MSKKVTSPAVAKKSSSILSNPSAGKNSKSSAGSALSQVSPPKVTSKETASKASQVLSNPHSSTAAKSSAASALSQRSDAKKRK